MIELPYTEQPAAYPGGRVLLTQTTKKLTSRFLLRHADVYATSEKNAKSIQAAWRRASRA